MNVDIKQIVAAMPNREVRSDIDPRWYLKYTDVTVGEPCIDEGAYHGAQVTPFQCRLRDCTYYAPISVKIKFTRGHQVRRGSGCDATTTDTAPPPTTKSSHLPPPPTTTTTRPQIVKMSNVPIGRIPIMLRSCKCVLSGSSDEELAAQKECPFDPGGYFIIKGVEKVILMQEQVRCNTTRQSPIANHQSLIATCRLKPANCHPPPTTHHPPPTTHHPPSSLRTV